MTLQLYGIISWQARGNSQGNLLYHHKWVLTDSLNDRGMSPAFPWHLASSAHCQYSMM